MDILTSICANQVAVVKLRVAPDRFTQVFAAEMAAVTARTSREVTTSSHVGMARGQNTTRNMTFLRNFGKLGKPVVDCGFFLTVLNVCPFKVHIGVEHCWLAFRKPTKNGPFEAMDLHGCHEDSCGVRWSSKPWQHAWAPKHCFDLVKPSRWEILGVFFWEPISLAKMDFYGFLVTVVTWTSPKVVFFNSKSIEPQLQHVQHMQSDHTFKQRLCQKGSWSAAANEITLMKLMQWQGSKCWMCRLLTTLKKVKIWGVRGLNCYLSHSFQLKCWLQQDAEFQMNSWWDLFSPVCFLNLASRCLFVCGRHWTADNRIITH